MAHRIQQKIKFIFQPFNPDASFNDRSHELRDLCLEVWRIGRFPKRV
jgi:hypothetical protein